MHVYVHIPSVHIHAITGSSPGTVAKLTSLCKKICCSLSVLQARQVGQRVELLHWLMCVRVCNGVIMYVMV